MSDPRDSPRDSRAALVVTDADGVVLDWSPGAERLLGWTAAEMRGRPLANIVASSDEAAAGSDPGNGCWHLMRDGGRLWTECERMALHYPPGIGAGILHILHDRTALRREEHVLRELADRLGRLEDAGAMAAAAAEILGRTLGAASAGYGRMSEDGLFFEMARDWTAPGVPSLPGRLRVAEFGSYYDALRRGETVAIPDVRLDPRTAGTAAVLEAVSARAFVNLPLIEHDRLVALFFVLSDQPRAWPASDMAFIRAVAERTRSAVERRRAEDALRALAASLEQQVAARTRERDQIWRASRDMLCVASLDGYFVQLNPAWTSTLGWSLEELCGRPFIEFVHPDDMAGTVRSTGELAADRPQLGFENRYRCRDGRFRWLSWNAVPRDGMIYANVRDVTPEREQAAELRRSRATLRALFETSFQLQALLDLEGTVLDANAVSLAAIGCTLDEVAGRPYWDTPWFNRTTGLPERVRAAVATAAGGQAVRDAVTATLAAGPRSLDVSIQPLRDEFNQIVAIVSEAVDTTERVVAEEKLRQSQKMEAVGQLTGGLAHDFNNLLTGITGSLELMQTRVAQGRIGEVERYVLAAQGAARRATALTHRLLAFSRRQTLEPKPTSANRLVTGMEEMIRRTVGPEIALEVVTASGLWNTLVDPGQLENALLNLCINARDAMPDGGRLTIETANRRLDEHAAHVSDLSPGQYVALCVSDTGTGMTPDVMAKAFDPFFTTKPIGMGTGLGLSMIYGFARQSEGHARIYSEVGQGSMVCLYLPRHLGEADPNDQPVLPVPSGRTAGHETVLVVDDEPTLRMLITEVLQDLGYRAIEAADGAAGLALLRSDARIDLVVSDVGLPGGMNGRQMADAARVLRPGLKVLFITGYAENAVLSHGHLDAGMHVLTKPFAMDALARRVRELIAG